MLGRSAAIRGGESNQSDARSAQVDYVDTPSVPRQPEARAVRRSQALIDHCVTWRGGVVSYRLAPFFCEQHCEIGISLSYSDRTSGNTKIAKDQAGGVWNTLEERTSRERLLRDNQDAV